ncbi:chitin synthase III catalytic subunit [Phellopilus nigrolimitatus]|nr:chitin synthase III catalytic subunit [Phellopilus nigrolimitatus]
MARFGDLAPLCRQVPSYTWCNLFYRQLQKSSNSTLSGFSANSATAPIGVNPECGIPLVGTSNSLTSSNSLGNIADIVVCGVSIVFVLALVLWTSKRKAAVGRSELRIFLVLYLLTLPFQLVSTGSLLEQGSTALVAVTAIHAGLVASLFWTLLANALVATQVVEDGTVSSLIPIFIFTAAFFAATTYISFDVALTITSAFVSNPPEALHSVPFFVLTSIWPLAAAFLYFVLMAYIVLGVLRERRPMLYYVAAAVCFILAQLAWFLLGKVVCRGSSAKVDGSFIATILETAAVGSLYLGWRSITEESWDDYNY